MANDLVERLDTLIKDDHERGCQGRYYSCTCDYDNNCSQALQDAKGRIEALEAALRECIDVMGPMAKHLNVNPWLIQAKQALEGSGND